MTAHASSSSATAPPEDAAGEGGADPACELDLLSSGRLPPLPTAFLRGAATELLLPVRFLPPGALPSGPPPAVDRAALAAGLGVANASYGHPRSDELSRLLADPATRVVVAGQQPGLFGGPLMTLTKMAATVRWAEAIAAEGGPAVAVFWIATEDHDWAESSRATLLTGAGPRVFDLGADPAPLLPLGMRTLGPRLAEIAAEVEEALAAPAVAELLDRVYRPDARFGEAFAKLAVAVLGERTPLLLDSMLPAVKEAQRPHLRRLVEARDAVDRGLAAADAALRERDLPLQVRPQPGLSPLFLLRGGERRRIEWTGAGFGLRGLEGFAGRLDDLLETIDENPAAVSPGVLARPAIQDAILGTTLQVMGPAELSYMAQVAPLYDILGVAAPWTTLRPQVTVLEARQVAHLEELGTSVGEVLSRPVEEIVAARLGDDPVAPVRARVDEALLALRELVLAVDATLERPWEKTREAVGRSLDVLAGKVTAATARRHGVWTNRLEKLRDALLPEGHLQERELAVVYYLARFGDGFVDALFAQLGLDPRCLHVVRLAPEHALPRAAAGDERAAE